MVPRLAGGCLGLFAFSVATVSGLAAGNPVTVILSRSILAMFLFCLLGALLGAAAQMVINEHARTREREIRARYRDAHEGGEEEASEPAPEPGAAPVGG